jgi:alpha-tubulin suppressor-like RCC1 family protein
MGDLLRTAPRVATALFVLFALGCGDDAPPGTDASTRVCVDDSECDDGIFCNGAELCAPDSEDANAIGCVIGPRPCGEAERCDEEMELCRASCDVSADADGDGHEAIACGGDDCDDSSADVNPSATEVCDDLGVDEDCDPATFGMRDLDGDGFVDAACCNPLADGGMNCGEDCGDRRRDQRPGNTEACDGLDNDCDGMVDEGVIVDGWVDDDNDLHGDPDMPTAACPGSGGFATVDDDCDDTDPEIHGAQLELCDGKDNNCNGMTDEAPAAVSWYPDEDADGFGTASGTVIVSCEPVEGHSVRSSDCNDMDSNIRPGAREICNAIDDDCNGVADATIMSGDLEDDDGDGFPDATCGGNDCNDSDASVYPGAPELCDGIDNDCDGVADGADAGANWYLDLDGDGFGDESAPAIESCDPQPMRVPRGGDCDDGDASVRPGVSDPCGSGDQDCDGEVDESGVRFAFYRDDDGDGFGDPGGGYVFACTAPDGRSDNPNDCDDGEANTYPGADERCDSEDNDCDTVVDEDAPTLWYPDQDLDGSGATSGSVETCDPPANYVTSTGDCDDLDPLRTPGADERCDDLDNDCDGTVDEGADAACAVTNGSGTCNAGVCEVDSCDASFEDCDSSVATGCEVDTRADPFNCGGCGMICGIGDSCGATAGTCDESPFVQIMLGADFSTALRASGGIAAWGDNFQGMLGDGSQLDRHQPVRGPFGFGFVQLDAARSHMCARTAAGRVYCWGENTGNGVLGNDSNVASVTPVRAGTLDDIIDIATAQDHSCAIEMGGQVWCWGDNEYGQLGIPGTTAFSRVPVMAAVDDAIEVFVGGGTTTIGRAEHYTCALRPLAAGSGNRVSCWGANEAGQLGDGNLGIHSETPVDVVGLPTDVIALADGPNSHYTCARTASGNVYCWGFSGDGGNGSTANLATATPVSTSSGPLAGVVDVQGGAFGTCALRSTGTAGSYAAWCWGSNNDGGMGINDTLEGADKPPGPVLEDGSLTEITDAKLIAMGRNHGCLVRTDDSIWCWGDDSAGQIGDDETRSDRFVATRVARLP